ncbi:hypothetical protein BH23BAC1_BH23BAC1_49630 [soil metagenome]
MTEAILLGTVAIRTPGKVLEWNSQNLKFPKLNILMQRNFYDVIIVKDGR